MTSAIKDVAGRRDGALEALGAARAEIEGRFLSGGAALVSVLDIVNRLLQALDGVANAMHARDGADATDALLQTKDRLLALPAAERGRQERLARRLGDTTAILAMMSRMSETLSQVRICAVMTKITGADMPEFAGFANDVIGGATLAEKQIAFFSERLARLKAHLVAAREEGERTVASSQTAAPELGRALLDSATFLSQRKTELAALAVKVGGLAEEVRSKVSIVLSSLQIGDITRQRIEHVEAGLKLIESLLARDAPDDGAAFVNTATRLLAAQMDDLTDEFGAGARRIVATLADIGRSAQAILAARDMVASDAGASGSGFLGALDRKIAEALAVVSAIERARTKAADIRAASISTADDLLGNVGSLGNIRDVKDDMRCLAINAYIKCSRVGERARSVAAVAMELQVLATRLGGLTDQVLGEVSKLKDGAALIEGGPTEALGSAIEDVAAAVRTARDRMDANLAEMDLLGAAVAENVDATVAALDFERDLGEALSRASSGLAISVDPELRNDPVACERLRAFSQELLRLYTMASERTVHQTVMPWAAAPASAFEPADADDFEDALF